MGYFLGGLFQAWNSAFVDLQTVVLTQMRQWGVEAYEWGSKGIPWASFASKGNTES